MASIAVFGQIRWPKAIPQDAKSSVDFACPEPSSTRIYNMHAGGESKGSLFCESHELIKHPPLRLSIQMTGNHVINGIHVG